MIASSDQPLTPLQTKLEYCLALKSSFLELTGRPSFRNQLDFTQEPFSIFKRPFTFDELISAEVLVPLDRMIGILRYRPYLEIYRDLSDEQEYMVLKALNHYIIQACISELSKLQGSSGELVRKVALFKCQACLRDCDNSTHYAYHSKDCQAVPPDLREIEDPALFADVWRIFKHQFLVGQIAAVNQNQQESQKESIRSESQLKSSRGTHHQESSKASGNDHLYEEPDQDKDPDPFEAPDYDPFQQHPQEIVKKIRPEGPFPPPQSPKLLEVPRKKQVSEDSEYIKRPGWRNHQKARREYKQIRMTLLPLANKTRKYDAKTGVHCLLGFSFTQEAILGTFFFPIESLVKWVNQEAETSPKLDLILKSKRNMYFAARLLYFELNRPLPTKYGPGDSPRKISQWMLRFRCMRCQTQFLYASQFWSDQSRCYPEVIKSIRMDISVFQQLEYEFERLDEDGKLPQQIYSFFGLPLPMSSKSKSKVPSIKSNMLYRLLMKARDGDYSWFLRMLECFDFSSTPITLLGVKFTHEELLSFEKTISIKKINLTLPKNKKPIFPKYWPMKKSENEARFVAEQYLLNKVVTLYADHLKNEDPRGATFNLQDYMQHVLGLKPYQCQGCRTAFGSPRRYFKHVRSCPAVSINLKPSTDFLQKTIVYHHQYAVLDHCSEEVIELELPNRSLKLKIRIDLSAEVNSLFGSCFSLSELWNPAFFFSAGTIEAELKKCLGEFKFRSKREIYFCLRQIQIRLRGLFAWAENKRNGGSHQVCSFCRKYMKVEKMKHLCLHLGLPTYYCPKCKEGFQFLEPYALNQKSCFGIEIEAGKSEQELVAYEFDRMEEIRIFPKEVREYSFLIEI